LSFKKMPCGSTGGKVMKKNGKIRFLAEDEIELEQIKSDLKVIRLALLQEILKQAKSMDPDPNLIARLSSIYLKVSARLEKMIRGDIVPSRLDNDSGDSSPKQPDGKNVQKVESCQQCSSVRANPVAGADVPSPLMGEGQGEGDISPSLVFSPTRGEKKGDNVPGDDVPSELREDDVHEAMASTIEAQAKSCAAGAALQNNSNPKNPAPPKSDSPRQAGKETFSTS
jgi:hypothetical protein